MTSMDTETPQIGNGQEPEPEVVDAATGVPVEESVFDRLRRIRDVNALDRTKTYTIPGWNNEVQVKYRMLDGDQFEEIQKRHQRAKNLSAVDMAADYLIAACITLQAWNPKTEEFFDLVDDSGANWGLDSSAAAFMLTGIQPTSGRGACKLLFLGNDLAITAQNSMVQRWMAGGQTILDEMIAGE
jgi:hypothetical protein